MLAILLLSFASIGGGLFALSGNGEYEWVISSSEESEAQDALASAVNLVETSVVAQDRSSASKLHNVIYIYEHKDASSSNLFTPANVQSMCETERLLVNRDDFIDFCVLDAPLQCADNILSLPLKFYGLDHDWSCPLLSATEVSTTLTALIDSLDTDDGLYENGFFFGKNVLDLGISNIGRSVINVGAPLEDFASETILVEEQNSIYQGFFEKWELDMWEFFGKVNTVTNSAYNGPNYLNSLRVRFWGLDIQNLEFQRLASFDMIFTLFAIVFVWIWIYVHIGSFFMANVAMTQIICSLPVALIFYKKLFAIPYFEILHILCIFLVLGIGADDVFVLVDAWRQTEFIVPMEDGETLTSPSYMRRRMNIAYMRCTQAVFNTSFTTCCAFIATAISPIMPVSTFGIYASLCIVINYLMVITISPAAVIVWHIYYYDKSCAQVCCGNKSSIAEKVSNDDDDKYVAGKKVGSKPSIPVEARNSLVDKFFDKFYIPLMAPADTSENDISKRASASSPSSTTTKYKSSIFAIMSVLVTAAWGITMLIYALQLTPPTQQEIWFPSDHQFTGFLDDNDQLFLSGNDEQYVEMYFAWGISGIDRGPDFSRYSPNGYRGVATFDSNFDLSDDASQVHFLKACQLIRDAPCTAEGCSGGGNKDILVREGTVSCFMEEFNDWHLATYSVTTSAASLSKTEFVNRVTTFRATETPLNGGNWEEDIGLVDGEIKFVRVRTISTLLKLQSTEVKTDVRDFVDTLLSSISKDAPTTFSSILNDAGAEWTFHATEQGLVTGLFIGFAICFPIAFIVLIGATHNIIVSLYAITAIIFVVASVLGFTKAFMNYDLGIAESMAGIIVIGFSVDYVVHMAHMFIEATEHGARTKEERFIYSARNMGGTVVAGAITTGGSGAFMFFCQLSFFYKMALLIVMTIASSIVFALFFFMPLCLLLGPDTDFGNIITRKGSIHGVVSGDNAESNDKGNNEENI